MRLLKLIVAFVLACVPRKRSVPGDRDAPKQWKFGDFSYLQTWDRLPYNRTLYRCLQALCGLFGSHEASETELATAGDGVFESHCRWCDQTMIVTEHPAMRQVEYMTKCHQEGTE